MILHCIVVLLHCIVLLLPKLSDFTRYADVLMFLPVGGAIEKAGGPKFVQEVTDLLVSLKQLETAAGTG